MENVRISCSCGEIYHTVISHYLKPVAPPMVYEKAHNACPKCNYLYTEKEDTNKKVRTIYLISEDK